MGRTVRTGQRGAPHVRLRIGFVVIAMLLSVFGARLVQLQGFDPHQYAAAAAAENLIDRVLPAERGDILDRDGEPLADSVAGVMIIADPKLTYTRAPEIAKFFSTELGVDYFTALDRLREWDPATGEGSRYEYLARRVPSTVATDALKKAEELGFKGLWTERDPVRAYPAEDVAANLVGFVGTDEPLAGFERTFDTLLSGKDGKEQYEAGSGNRIPLGKNSTVPPVDGANLQTTIDRELQLYTQRVLADAVARSGAESGFAVVLDRATGEVLTLADVPTFDATDPAASDRADRGARSMSDVYEPGSVQKVLTVASLLDAGKVTPRTRIKVPPVLPDPYDPNRQIGDWFDHGTLRLTLAGVIAKSSNIGTVLAADNFEPGQLRSYLAKFGLGQKTNVGIRGESAGILPAPGVWNEQIEDRIDFGQSLSVNGLQMAAAVNAIANGGVLVSPSVIKGSATTDAGEVVGTDHTTRTRVVSEQAARDTARMMERVVDPEAGTAPGAGVEGYRVAGKTGTAQRVNSECGCYDGTFTISFAGFAPADDPRFTVYVVIQDPKNGGGGGSLAGPVFAKVMSFALQRYGVPPTGTRPSRLPVTW